jgi:hypothetical protein
MVFAHDPQQSMVMTMNDSATAYVSGWNKIGSSERRSSDRRSDGGVVIQQRFSLL